MSVAGLTGFIRPDSVEEAFAALDGTAVPVAGGTDLIHGLPSGVEQLIDLSGVGLGHISSEPDGGLLIGATATLTEVLEHPAVPGRNDDSLTEMLLLVGSPLLRNAATLGGHLARGRLSDVIPLFIALDAEVSLYDGESRTMPLADYYAGDVHKTLHLLTETRLPRDRPGTGTAFLKLSRVEYDIALINAATRVDRGENGNVSACRIVVGETPWLGASIPEAEAVLTGGPLDDTAIADTAAAAGAHVRAGDDIRASAEYRCHLATVIVRRCLERCRTNLEGGR